MPLGTTTIRESTKRSAAAALLALAGVAGGGPIAQAAEEAGPFAHLRALQDIATAHGGNRAAGTPGYDRSAAGAWWPAPWATPRPSLYGAAIPSFFSDPSGPAGVPSTGRGHGTDRPGSS